MRVRALAIVMALVVPLAFAVCDPGTEPVTLTLPVVADGTGPGVFENDLGFEIELTALRVALRDLELTVGGETHSRLGPGVLRRALSPVAFAHPGHYAGGDVTGELPGRFVVDFFSGGDAPLGDATLLEGDYHGLNFTFRAADADDGLDASDPLLGHTFAIAGVARRDEREIPFDAVLDLDDDTQMVGGPFTFEAQPGSAATLVFRLLPVDPSTEGDTAFDGIDFAAAPAGEMFLVRPGDDAHNVLRRRIQVHDHWWLEPRGA